MERFNVRIVFDRKKETAKNPQKAALIHIEVVEKNTKKKRCFSTDVKSVFYKRRIYYNQTP